jgi:hypothetical protein
MSDAQQPGDAASVPRAYVADKPANRPTSDELRSRIPGWGVDLDPADRPSYPRERREETGAHWDFPERQEDLHHRERSIEHGILPPVFGTVAPLHGVSGIVRRTAYARFSEARLAHWLLLIAGDRIDAFGAHAGSLLRGDAVHPIAETGIGVELAGADAEEGTGRADRGHRLIDPVIVAGPWIVAGWVGLRMVRRLLRAR